jgi:pimeloyl-ACP methyl ester carboxylesterase
MRLCRIARYCLLLLTLAHSALRLPAQKNQPPYGANGPAGHFLQSADARIYYEVYGSGGTPLVLLHGNVYGYIDEFSDLIRQMSRHRRVIAIATRGHGKSEIGRQPFSYELFAADALAVIRHETHQPVDVLGFSGGAMTSYLLAAEHPELVRRLVAIGGPRGQVDWAEDAISEARKAQPSDLEKNDPRFVGERRKLMPEPERWEEFSARMLALEKVAVWVTDQQLHSIRAPTLIVAGDRDPYNQPRQIVEIFQQVPQSQLALIPDCGHVVLECKSHLVIEVVSGFLDKISLP